MEENKRHTRLFPGEWPTVRPESSNPLRIDERGNPARNIVGFCFKPPSIERDPSPGPWSGKEARFPEYVATERTQSHSALPGNVLRPPRPLA